ncbi:hypothetical protein BKA69DRAFT_1105661 [Paraphysoderma sedebokerense]|nr:hypothetical protein BKA69DRAFT_1105661 [Paraphysoderma sedebokerense]
MLDPSDENLSDVLPIETDSRHRPSLLDVIREKYKFEKHSVLYRVILIGEVSSQLENKQEVGTHFQRFFKNFQSESESVTGLLLVLGNHYVHIVEVRTFDNFCRERGK